MNQEINLPPFYVGQRVVALVSSAAPTMVPYEKGDEFTVSKFAKSKAGEWHMSFIGRPEDEFYDCNNFAPIESTFSAITLSEVIEIETPLICNN